MPDFQLRPGDEILITRRRHVTTETVDGETGKTTPIESIEDVTFAAVRCPEQMIVAGGSVDPEYDDEQRYLTIRLKAR